jgi:hypothetical protein
MKLDAYSEVMRALMGNVALARGPQITLPIIPAHEVVANLRSAELHVWARDEFDKLRHETDQRFKHIASFYNRSIAQRRRFWRVRIIQEKTA